MAFIQIIEVTTTRPEEMQELVEEWSARTEGRRTAYRSTLTADRDRPGTYVQIVEFPSYQEAMANSGLPETGEFAEKLARLCDGPPVFRNLDVRRVDDVLLSLTDAHRGPEALPGRRQDRLLRYA